MLSRLEIAPGEGGTGKARSLYDWHNLPPILATVIEVIGRASVSGPFATTAMVYRCIGDVHGYSEPFKQGGAFLFLHEAGVLIDDGSGGPIYFDPARAGRVLDVCTGITHGVLPSPLPDSLAQRLDELKQAYTAPPSLEVHSPPPPEVISQALVKSTAHMVPPVPVPLTDLSNSALVVEVNRRKEAFDRAADALDAIESEIRQRVSDARDQASVLDHILDTITDMGEE